MVSLGAEVAGAEAGVMDDEAVAEGKTDCVAGVSETWLFGGSLPEVCSVLSDADAAAGPWEVSEELSEPVPPPQAASSRDSKMRATIRHRALVKNLPMTPQTLVTAETSSFSLEDRTTLLYLLFLITISLLLDCIAICAILHKGFSLHKSNLPSNAQNLPNSSNCFVESDKLCPCRWIRRSDKSQSVAC